MRLRGTLKRLSSSPIQWSYGKAGVSYRGFGFSFGTEIDGSQKEEGEYGSAEYIDYQLKYFTILQIRCSGENHHRDKGGQHKHGDLCWHKMVAF
jgi:hypothetical protein